MFQGINDTTDEIRWNWGAGRRDAAGLARLYSEMAREDVDRMGLRSLIYWRWKDVCDVGAVDKLPAKVRQYLNNQKENISTLER